MLSFTGASGLSEGDKFVEHFAARRSPAGDVAAHRHIDKAQPAQASRAGRRIGRVPSATEPSRRAAAARAPPRCPAGKSAAAVPFRDDHCDILILKRRALDNAQDQPREAIVVVASRRERSCGPPARHNTRRRGPERMSLVSRSAYARTIPAGRARLAPSPRRRRTRCRREARPMRRRECPPRHLAIARPRRNSPARIPPGPSNRGNLHRPRWHDAA